MIKISGLSFTYPGAAQPGLRNITLEIQKGDFLAIIGNNGCGKSTLCKAINGLIPHFFAGDYEGTVEVCGLDTRTHSIGELSVKVGYVYQDFENQIVRPTVLDDVSFACLNYAMDDYIEKGLRALRMTGLEKKATDYVWQLSGGQKHLLALAGALALSPDILILDEPVAQLDPRHARSIYETLRNLNEEHGKTIIVIEHHTEFIAEYCKNVVLMRDGKIQWKLGTKKALGRVEELEMNSIFPPQVTLAAKLLRDKRMVPAYAELPVTMEEGAAFFSALPIRLPDRAKKPSRTENIKPEDKKEGMVSKPAEVISFCDVSVEYRAVKVKNPPVLDHFNHSIYKGEKVALIGSNGAGKSTLMKLMTGLLKPNSGTVSLCGTSTRDLSPEEISQKVSLVYQNPEEMFINDSIRGDIEYSMKVRNIPDYGQRTDELLEMFNLTELAQRDGRLLSGGQMRRASLAVGIALNPSILLLDEPTANLDIATRKEIIRTMKRLNNVTDTVIIATHDMQLVTEWATRVTVLADGYVIGDGTCEEIFNNRFVSERVGILPPEIYRVAKAIAPCLECFNVLEFVNCFTGSGERGNMLWQSCPTA